MAKKFKELRAKMSTSRQQRNKADADRLAKRMDEVSKERDQPSRVVESAYCQGFDAYWAMLSRTQESSDYSDERLDLISDELGDGLEGTRAIDVKELRLLRCLQLAKEWRRCPEEMAHLMARFEDR